MKDLTQEEKKHVTVTYDNGKLSVHAKVPFGFRWLGSFSDMNILRQNLEAYGIKDVTYDSTAWPQYIHSRNSN